MTNEALTVEVGRGQHVRPGEYRIVAASLKLVVTASSASIVMVTGYPSSVVVEIPLEGFVVQSPEDNAAKEAVLGYLQSAWPAHYAAALLDWMKAEEYHNGLAVWRLKYCHEYEDAPVEPNRPLIEQEVSEWLKAQAPSLSPY